MLSPDALFELSHQVAGLPSELDPESEEAKRFEAAWCFFANRQHDHLDQSWEGMPRKPGMEYLRERYYPRGFVPLNVGSPVMRKPDMPTPTAAVIVNRNTGLMLGTLANMAPEQGTGNTQSVSPDIKAPTVLYSPSETTEPWSWELNVRSSLPFRRRCNDFTIIIACWCAA